MLPGVLCAFLSEESGEMRMTMRGERTHAERVGQGEGLPVVALRAFDIAWIAARRDFTEQTHTPCLVTSLILAPGKGQTLVSLA